MYAIYEIYFRIQIVRMIAEEKTYLENVNLGENPEVNDKQLASSLAGLRKAQKLTQTDLANKVGCTLRTIQNLEAGKPVSADMKHLVANALGHTLEINYNLIPKDNEK